MYQRHPENNHRHSSVIHIYFLFLRDIRLACVQLHQCFRISLSFIVSEPIRDVFGYSFQHDSEVLGHVRLCPVAAVVPQGMLRIPGLTGSQDFRVTLHHMACNGNKPFGESWLLHVGLGVRFSHPSSPSTDVATA